MDKLSLLESVPIFSDLSKSDLTKIAERMTHRKFNKNQMILLEDIHMKSDQIVNILRNSIKS